MNLKKTFSAALLAGAMLAAGSAVAAPVYPNFTVDPDSSPSTLNSFEADKITGNYTEIVTFLGGNAFTVSLHWDGGQFVANDGALALPGATTGLGNTYGLYADFNGSGTVSTSLANVTTFSLASGGLLNVYLDPTPATPGGGNLLATGLAVSGTGTIDPNLPTCGTDGINCGSFGQTTTFELINPVGTNFFVLPNPFYNLSFQSGQLNNFTLSGTQTINGSMDAVFGNAVPEPTSIALLGLALLGLGFTQRRKA